MTLILRERIPSTDARLGRHVHHDSRSRAYAYPTLGLPIVSTVHARHTPILDQGQIGSCTGNAAVGALSCAPYWTGKPGPFPLDESGAVAVYSAATRADDIPGQYPPEDTGSDGLSVAKVLKASGVISGYQHTFSADAALRALGQTPILLGVAWHADMFNPDPDGRIHPTGPVQGGHEILSREVDAERERVWLDNSWGSDFGVAGRCWLSFEDFTVLLAEQGDVTILTPLSQPAPVPVPDPSDPDHALAAALRTHGWVTCRHVGTTRTVATAAANWLSAKCL